MLASTCPLFALAALPILSRDLEIKLRFRSIELILNSIKYA